MSRSFILASLLTLVAADVMPDCGCNSGPKPVNAGPGQNCGPEGHSFIATCTGPTECLRGDRTGSICTAHCTTDADCTNLGPHFTCSLSAEHSYGTDAGPPSLCSELPPPAPTMRPPI